MNIFNRLFIGVIVMLALVQSVHAQFGVNNGSSCASAIQLYLDTDCNNYCPVSPFSYVYCGSYNCPDELCGSVDLIGTSDLDPSCSAGDERTEPCLWMKFTATTTTVDVTSDRPYTGSPSSVYNRKDYVLYGGSCGSLIEMGCQTINGGSTGTFTGLTAGQQYFVMVSTADGGSIGTLARPCLTSSVPYVNPYDDCASAFPLTDGTQYQLTTANATPDGNTGVCGGSVENNVWGEWCCPLTWNPGDTAYIHVYNQTCNSSAGLQVSVQAGGEVCGSFTPGAEPTCTNPLSTSDFYGTWVPTPGECYMIQVDGYAGTGCSFRMQVNDTLTPLPVTLAGFNAKVQPEWNELTWKSAVELNADKYVVEAYRLESFEEGDRAIAGEDWEVIGELPVQGSEASYFFKDHSPANINFYRLRMVDHDGSFDYSKILATNRKIVQEKIALSLYPTNVEDWVHVEGGSADLVEIWGLDGRKVVHASNSAADLDLTELKPGMYLYAVTKMVENDLHRVEGKLVKR